MPGNLVRSAEVIQLILDEIALTARHRWPRWFGTKLVEMATTAPEADLRLPATLAKITAEHDGVDRRWLERTIQSLRFDGPLRPHACPPASELQQWLGAIGERTVVLLPEGNCSAHLDAVVAVFRWLVDAVRCNVELHVGPELPDLAGALAPIAYYAVDDEADASHEAPPPAHDHQDRESQPAQRTKRDDHPGFRSGTEARLANAMQQDPAMAGRFYFNKRVDAAYAYAYEVDVLWRDGPLIVEVDGYRWHSDRKQFRADRERDYRLMLKGYRILRLTHEEVEQDVAMAVDKIRDMMAMLAP